MSCYNLFACFKTRLEELQERMEKLKRELKKQKDKESSLLEEKDILKQVQERILACFSTYIAFTMRKFRVLLISVLF